MNRQVPEIGIGSIHNYDNNHITLVILRRIYHLLTSDYQHKQQYFALKQAFGGKMSQKQVIKKRPILHI